MSQETPTLQANTREKLGTRYTTRLRKEGRLPAVVYGHGEDPAHVEFDAKAFNEAVHTGAHVYDVTIDGKTDHCLLKAVQWDYMGREIIHADFTRVDLTEEVEVQVELVLTGEPKAAQASGVVLEHPITEITVKCAANKIPDNIEVDITDVTDEAPIHVSDVTLPAGLTLISDGEGIVAQISVVKVKAAAEDEDGSAEPEVIEKGKAEDAE